MKNLMSIFLFVLLSALVFPSLASCSDGDEQFALKGALVYTVVGIPIPDATILVDNGKITAVGRDLHLPEGIKVYDVAGKVIHPA